MSDPISDLFQRAKHATTLAATIAKNEDSKPPWILIRELATLVGSVAEMVMDAERARTSPQSPPQELAICRNPTCRTTFNSVSYIACPTCGDAGIIAERCGA